jgi:hypothetical protein
MRRRQTLRSVQIQRLESPPEQETFRYAGKRVTTFQVAWKLLFAQDSRTIGTILALRNLKVPALWRGPGGVVNPITHPQGMVPRIERKHAMLDIILSHWATYIYLAYMLLLVVVVLWKRSEPVHTAGRPLTDQALSSWCVPQQGAMQSRQSLLN